MCDKNQALKIRDEAYLLCRDIFLDKLTDCYLYGSYARGDYNNDSDIDIMMVVDLTPEEVSLIRSKVSSIGSRLSLEYDVTVSINLQPKSILERYKDILLFYQNVLREGIRYE